MIESHDQIRPLQIGDEFVDLALAVDAIFVARSAERDAHAHAHVVHVAPAADFISRFLSFQVEIKNVAHRRATMGQIATIQS